MSIYKTTSGDYFITIGPVVGGNGTGTLTISGNLEVVGNVTYIETSQLKIDDPFITVAANNTGTVQQMGMLGQTNTGVYAGLRFNTITNDWEITPSTNGDGTSGTWSPISTGTALPGAPNTSIQFNIANVFTGSSNFLFDSANSKVTLTGNLALGNIGSTPVSTANSATLYNKAVGTGGTGVYVKSTEVDDEICSKTQAIVFGIIF